MTESAHVFYAPPRVRLANGAMSQMLRELPAQAFVVLYQQS